MGCRKLSGNLKHFPQNVSIPYAKPPGLRLWQRNYYEHIIRNENDLNDIREYIVDNPFQWVGGRGQADAPGIIFEKFPRALERVVHERSRSSMI